jgi:putative hemolysin
MIWAMIGLGFAGLLLSAFFSGIETGFYRATRLRLVLDALGGDTVARGLVFLTNHPSLFVATTLAATSLANYMVSLAIVIATEAAFPERAHVAELVAPVVFAPLLLVYGELLPKSLFMRAPNRLLRWGGPAFLVFVVLLFPISGLLWLMSWIVERLLGYSAEPVRLVLARRELGRVIEEGHEAGILHPAQRRLAQGIFAVAAQPISDFLTPLAQFPRATSSMSKEEVLAMAQQHGVAVVPVESADRPGELAGYVRVIDLCLSGAPQFGPIRPLLELNEGCTHLAALVRLESAGESLARVVNAEGETLGLATAEGLRAPLV